tara:strand:- start:1556 stop:2671 length:1116 start_codon:yes stop_codon:yes gene_type:complete
MSYQLQSNAMASKILYIDSRDASSYLAQVKTKLPDNTFQDINLTSYFQYTLKEKIEVPLNQRALISLNSATIPYSFYNIRTGINDKLFVVIENTTDSLQLSNLITITSGNYTAYTFAEQIEDFLNSVDFQDVNKNIEFTFSMDYNTDLQKYLYRITQKAGNDKVIELTFQFLKEEYIGKSPHIEMGFRPNENVVMTLPSNPSEQGTFIELLSTNVIDMNGSIHGVYVRTNLVSNGTLDTQSGTFSNILGRIPIKVNAGGVIFSIPSNATHKSIVDIRSIDTLTIRLTDERNRILDLNGLHFQIAIAIDFIYAKRKQNVPMGSLNESRFGHSHIEDVRGRQEKFDRNKEQTDLERLIERFDKFTKIKKPSKK